MNAAAAERIPLVIPVVREASITQELCSHVGRRLAALADRPAIGVSCGGEAARALAKACLTGISDLGGRAWDFGCCIESQFEFCLGMSRADFGVYLGAGAVPRLHVTRWSANAAPGPDKELPPSVRSGSVGELKNLARLYPYELLKQCGAPLEGLSVAVEASSQAVRELLEEALLRLGCLATGKASITVRLAPDGRSASVAGPGIHLSGEQVLAAVCLPEFRRGRSVAVPSGAPRLLDRLAARYGGQVRRYGECRCDLAAAQPWPRDGLMQAVRLLSILSARRTGAGQAAVPFWEQPLFCQ